MKWHTILFIFLVLFAVLFLYNLINQPNSITTRPAQKKLSESDVNCTLVDIVKINWNSDLSEISKIIPKGTLRRSRINNKELNVYSFIAYLKDINAFTSVTFQSSENGLGELVPTRTMSVQCDSKSTIDIKFNEIIDTVKSIEEKVLPFGKSEYHDEAYQVYDPDGNGGVKLDFNIDYDRSRIHIMLTRFTVIKKIYPKNET